MSRQQNINCSFDSKTWYLCPYLLTIFIIFIFLFIYSLRIVIKCTSMITDPQFNESKYNIKLNELFTLYIINIIVTFISVFVIIYFIMKAMPATINEFLLSNTIGCVFVSYIFIACIFTLSIFRKVQSSSKDILVFIVLAMIASFIGLVFYITKLVHTSKEIQQYRL